MTKNFLIYIDIDSLYKLNKITYHEGNLAHKNSSLRTNLSNNINKEIIKDVILINKIKYHYDKRFIDLVNKYSIGGINNTSIDTVVSRIRLNIKYQIIDLNNFISYTNKLRNSSFMADYFSDYLDNNDEEQGNIEEFYTLGREGYLENIQEEVDDLQEKINLGWDKITEYEEQAQALQDKKDRLIYEDRDGYYDRIDKLELLINACFDKIDNIKSIEDDLNEKINVKATIDIHMHHQLQVEAINKRIEQLMDTFLWELFTSTKTLMQLKNDNKYLSIDINNSIINNKSFFHLVAAHLI